MNSAPKGLRLPYSGYLRLQGEGNLFDHKRERGTREISQSGVKSVSGSNFRNSAKIRKKELQLSAISINSLLFRRKPKRKPLSVMNSSDITSLDTISLAAVI